MEPQEPKAGAGARILALLIGIALLFGALVMALIVINPDDIPLCSETVRAAAAGECFDISETQETVSSILAIPAAILGAIAGILGFVVAITGRRLDLMMRLGGAAVVLGVLTFLVNRI